jgi:hypothetical protein
MSVRDAILRQQPTGRYSARERAARQLGAAQSNEISAAQGAILKTTPQP